MALIDNIFSFPNVLHVQRDYNWDFILPNVGLIPGIVMSKYCQSVQLGQYNVGEILEWRKDVKKSYMPGLLEIQKLTATFVAPAPDAVVAYFAAWKKLMVDEDGNYGVPQDYKKNMSIVLYDRIMSIPTNVITVKGAFPVTFPSFNLSYESEKILRHTVEFRFDKIAIGLNAISSKTIVGKGIEKIKNNAFVSQAIDKIKNVL